MIITMYHRIVSQEVNYIKHFVLGEFIRSGSSCEIVLSSTSEKASKLTRAKFYLKKKKYKVIEKLFLV